MKKLLKTLKNIWSIEELRGKILFTLMMIAVYRVGSHIVLPGIDPTELKAGESNNGILGLIDAFSGGAFNNASIFALGIMPYISASIFMQLMTVLVPRFQKMQKEGDSGRKKINQYTRYLTVGVTILQASAYVSYLRGMTAQTGGLMAGFTPANFWLTTVVVLTAGTLFVMWMGEKITDKGLGNGTSLIIMIGILARLPQSFLQELSAKSVRSGDILVFIVEIAILIAIIMGCILLIQGVRKVPVNYAKQIVGNRQFGGARQFLPLKVNSAGVMPIIFAQAIIFIPTIFANFNPSSGSFLRELTDHKSLWYMLIYSVVVIGFTFLYTALIFNPKQIADNLKQNNGFIPGVKPGQATADYIGAIMDKITLPGAFLLAFVGILPGIAERFGVTQQFSTFFGGTSLLIMVGVILDTLQQIETQLLMRQYDGLMKSGRIQGRQTTSAVQM
ncbi:MAG: preprotein translocase subunit SecY [Ferruginibacter sp.]|nr:preprotein translocase subunit SecY [Chitinophagaceae bacterium]